MATMVEKPWLNQYRMGPYKLPQTKEPYPRVTVHSLLDATAAEFPDKAACFYLGREISYGELKLLSDRLAAALADLGVKKGDKVGVIAPAKKVDKEKTLMGIDKLSEWGLEVEKGEHLFETFHQFAGTDKQRTQDLQQMIDKPEIRAIFIARGGYGTTRIIDNIDFNGLLKHPKWISDRIHQVIQAS